jgi:hypothetical protein
MCNVEYIFVSECATLYMHLVLAFYFVVFAFIPFETQRLRRPMCIYNSVYHFLFFYYQACQK